MLERSPDLSVAPWIQPDTSEQFFLQVRKIGLQTLYKLGYWGDEAEDICHDAYIAIIQARKGQAIYAGYIVTTIRRLFVKRRRVNAETRESVHVSDRGEEAVEYILVDFKQLIAHLAPRDQEILQQQMKETQDEEIARTQGRTPRAIQQRRYILRQYIEAQMCGASSQTF